LPVAVADNARLENLTTLKEKEVENHQKMIKKLTKGCRHWEAGHQVEAAEAISRSIFFFCLLTGLKHSRRCCEASKRIKNSQSIFSLYFFLTQQSLGIRYSRNDQ
jgi:hypothetical protein